MRDEERNLITVALRLYLPGTSRKDTWSPKIRLVSACLVSVSVSLHFGFCFLFFCFGSWGLSVLSLGEGGQESKSPSKG